MEKRLMDQFVLAESCEELERVDQLYHESWKTKDKKIKSQALAEMRGIMKFEVVVGFHGTYKAVDLWRAISRRKLVVEKHGLTTGMRVRSSMRQNQIPGMIVGIRDDFVLKVKCDDGSQSTMSPHEAELI